MDFIAQLRRLLSRQRDCVARGGKNNICEGQMKVIIALETSSDIMSTAAAVSFADKDYPLQDGYLFSIKADAKSSGCCSCLAKCNYTGFSFFAKPKKD